MPVDLDILYRNQTILLNKQAPAEVLRSVRVFLSDYRRLARGAPARDRSGGIVGPAHNSAVSWSVPGAIGALSNRWGIVPPCILQFLDRFVFVFASKYREELQYSGGYFDCFEHFTDWLSHDWTMRFLDEAVEAMRNA